MRHLGKLLILAQVCAACVLVVGLLLVPHRSQGQQAAEKGETPAKRDSKDRATATEQFYAASFVPFVNKYCYDCHEGSEPESDVRLDEHQSANALLNDRDRWQKAFQMLQSGRMPPKDGAQPSAADREAVLRWLDDHLNYVDCEAPQDPGYVTIRRLNRAEYRNTVRDLLGVDFELPDDFPPDDVGYGFDTVGDVLSLPPILMEKYLTAAERVTDELLAKLQPEAGPAVVYGGNRLQGSGQGRRSGDAWWLNSRGEVFANHRFEQAGDYVIRVRVEGDQAGDELVRAAIMADGKEVTTFEIKSDGRIETAEHRLQLKPGSRRIGVAFLNDYYRPDAPNPSDRDRNMAVHDITILGPRRERSADESEALRRVFVARPGDGVTVDEAATRVLRSVASRAYRRPVSEDELARLFAFAKSAVEAKKDFHQGIALTLQAVLTSPKFLFKVESNPDVADAGQIRLLDEYELATRMSYFLWSTMPDDELFRQAAAGTLRKNLDQQVLRMLGDPRSLALAENFATQWLGLRNLDMMQPDRRRFPSYNTDLASAMQRESILFFDAVLREDRNVLDLIDADFSFVNGSLARHYGIGDVRGDKFQRVLLAADAKRGGVLTQASVLTVTSNPTRTSPVKRGKWVLENILGTPPPDPPPNVPELQETDEAIQSGSLRERLEQHRRDANCAVCHRDMDQLGFAMENFDAVGGWRAKDGRFDVDASGTLPAGEQFDGPSQLKRLLRSKYRDDFVRCLTEKMLTFALGRGVEYYDRCAIDEICNALRQDDYKISTLVTEIVRCDAFQKRRSKKLN